MSARRRNRAEASVVFSALVLATAAYLFKSPVLGLLALVLGGIAAGFVLVRIL